MKMVDKNKIILAYSGGLDTSVILRWLIEEYKAEVVPSLLIWDREDLEGIKQRL
jgi:argininosuccinate synthase